MSNIGFKTIKIPKNISICFLDKILILNNKNILVKITIPQNIFLNLTSNVLKLNSTTTKNNAVWGSFRSSIQNAIIGLCQGFRIDLVMKGVGYRVIKKDDLLVLKCGFSHLIEVNIPENIQVFCYKLNTITLQGPNKELLHNFARTIRIFKKPEPYKGKGILYKGEKIIKKEGKKK